MNISNVKTMRSQFPIWTCAGAASIWVALLVGTSAAAESKLVDVVESETAAELSVAPLDHVVYPDDRPSWLDKLPSIGGEVDSIVVVSEPALTAEAAAEELRWMQRAAIATYVSQLVDQPGQFDVFSPDDETINRDLVTRRYDGVVTIGDETHYESATELQFDMAQRKLIDDAWKNAEVGRRLKAFGGLASLGLVTLFCTGGLIGVVSRRFAPTVENR